MSVLTNEQVEEIVKMLLQEIPVKENEFIDTLVRYAIPEWPDMDERERDTFFCGFMRGYLACNEVIKHILNGKNQGRR
ncbi:hypothetical protein M4A92_15765 [Caldibacillus thermoamylovorans]|uniref:hypothetical protein n=1 Tax=Caldibacillus thermoamylovorans TaxID=35841 RepID=UPI00204044DF|nr:hypothetical protein [Caldibacillus thermoamylovorans]MCM3800052.1 hypothetical protein [Caldibacillus thermoamylovorans]